MKKYIEFVLWIIYTLIILKYIYYGFGPTGVIMGVVLFTWVGVYLFIRSERQRKVIGRLSMIQSRLAIQVGEIEQAVIELAINEAEIVHIKNKIRAIEQDLSRIEEEIVE